MRKPHGHWGIRLSCLALAILSLFSCSGEAPSLRDLKWLLIERIEGDSARESLSVFIAVSDADGLEDVKSFYLIHDDSELFWKLDPDSWTRKDQGESAWIGSNGFSLPEGKGLPSGNYRVIVIDEAGERDEREFMLTRPEASAKGAFSAKLSEGDLEIRSPYPAIQVLFLDGAGHTLGLSPGKTGNQSLSEMRASEPAFAQASSITVLSVDESSNRAAMGERIFLQ